MSPDGNLRPHQEVDQQVVLINPGELAAVVGEFFVAACSDPQRTFNRALAGVALARELGANEEEQIGSSLRCIVGGMPDAMSLTLPLEIVGMAKPHYNPDVAPANFGEVVGALQDSYAERMMTIRTGMAPPELSSARLIACLVAHDYSSSSGSFSSLRSGNTLPRNPEDFLIALFACLGLDPNEEIAKLAAEYLALDLLERDLGKLMPTYKELLPEGVSSYREVLDKRWIKEMKRLLKRDGNNNQAN